MKLNDVDSKCRLFSSIAMFGLINALDEYRGISATIVRVSRAACGKFTLYSWVRKAISRKLKNEYKITANGGIQANHLFGTALESCYPFFRFFRFNIYLIILFLCLRFFGPYFKIFCIS